MKNMYVLRIVIKDGLFFYDNDYTITIIFFIGGTSETEMGSFTSYYKKFL